MMVAAAAASEGGGGDPKDVVVVGAAAEATGGSNKKKKTVLVNMLNPDQALKVVASFKTFASQLDERFKDIRCYMVPSSPDIPLPPPLVDDTTKKVLGDKLWNNFVSLETVYAEKDSRGAEGKAGATATTTTTSPPGKGDAAAGGDAKAPSGNDDTGADGDDDDDKPKLLDADKAAAAAGGVGAYDADEDPLNAPQVLEAVKEFRRKLDQTHGSQKTQRMELVAKKLRELRPRIRAQVDAEKKQQQVQHQQQQRLGAPPPPMPSLPVPPPPGGLPPPPRASTTTAAADSGKRGRSNLPAWMTQQKASDGGGDDDEPDAKKARTTTGGYPSHFPSSLPPASHPVLRRFLANQVKESMGEEEATLIDFLHGHILQGKATSELLQELRVVLEEEADGFLKAVWSKVQELQHQ
mmetsp:Transcript_2724/g.7468  ORF Transcript_2724/g.7468 Transcript_2724/m.7468 type:complete len:409 (-) Transcript_2724:206-1432(-)